MTTLCLVLASLYGGHRLGRLYEREEQAARRRAMKRRFFVPGATPSEIVDQLVRASREVMR